MMHGHEKSGDAIVAVKPANKAERSAAEPVERRAEAEGNADQQGTHRTQSRVGVPQALDRMRQALAVVTRGGSRMRESCTYGSVRGASSNGGPYRDRREFVTLLGSAATAWSVPAGAQQGERMRRITVLMPLAADDPEARARILAFHRRLRELGWTDGQNVRIDYRWALGDTARIRAQAAESVSLKPDIIVGSSTPVVTALRAESRTIPILFVQVIDPVAAGFVNSLARPGGNLTGITNFEFTMGGKWLETLKEISPQLARVAVLYDPKTAPYAGSLLRSIAAAAPSFAIEPTDTPVQDAGETERAIEGFAQKPDGGLLVLPDVSTLFYRDLIITRAAQHRLPAVYPFRYFATSGGLVSYGIDSVDTYRQVASYVDRILRGSKPEDLPVQAPAKFELVINAQTAKKLGLNVPPTLLARADEVIE
jgi:putative ABC transport system substrate-binding protein